MTRRRRTLATPTRVSAARASETPEMISVWGMRVEVMLRLSGLDGTYVVTSSDPPQFANQLAERLASDMRRAGEEVGAYSLRDDNPGYPVIRESSRERLRLRPGSIRVLAPSEKALKRVRGLLTKYASSQDPN